MTYKLFVLIISTITGISILTSKSNAYQECTGAVGDVKYSYLDETAFEKVNGDCWIRMAGQPFSSDYKLHELLTTTGTPPEQIPSNLPDAQGMFIRGMDYEGKVDAGRLVGSKQEFSTAKPKLNFFGLTGEIDMEGKKWADLDKNYDFDASWLIQENGRRKLDGLHTHQYDHHCLL